jgi:hypothetical protein
MGAAARGIFAYGVPFKGGAEDYAFEWAQQFEGDGWRYAQALAGEHGVDVEYLGRDDYGLPFVHVLDSLRSAAWAEVIAVRSLDIPYGWDDRLRAYVAATALDLTRCTGPGWYLSSSYG